MDYADYTDGKMVLLARMSVAARYRDPFLPSV